RLGKQELRQRRSRRKFLKLVKDECSRGLRRQAAAQQPFRALGDSLRGRVLLVEQFHHLLDGLDSGNRLGRIWKRKRYGTEQLAVDVYRTSTHSCNDPSACERAAREACEYHVLFGREVFQNAEQLDIELLDLRSLENRLTKTLHAGA